MGSALARLGGYFIFVVFFDISVRVRLWIGKSLEPWFIHCALVIISYLLCANILRMLT